MRRTDGWRWRTVKIVTLEQLKQMPAGTMFAETDGGNPTLYPKSYPHIITNKVKSGWNGSLVLFPAVEEVNGKLYSQAFCFDDSHVDYDENQTFFVWSKQDIQNMIDWLMFALSDCKTDYDDEKWWNEEGTDYKTDKEMEQYL